MTIKQIRKAIEQNTLSIFTFEGFNSERDTALKNELLHTLKEKYSRPRDTDEKRIIRAGKTREAEAYFMLKHGQTTPLTYKQAINSPMFIDDFCCTDVTSENERTPIQKEVIRMLLDE